MKPALMNVSRVLLLALAYVVLFVVGSQLFAPQVEGAKPGDAAEAMRAIVVMAIVDSALVMAAVRTSRLHGLKLMLLISGVFYFVKTVTSQLEALYFMPNVTAPMLPQLLLMTLPLSVVLGPLAVWLGGRANAGPLDEPVKWELRSPSLWSRGAVLSAVVYPALFFLAGWYIAFASEELRTFYGGAHGDTILSHYAWVFRHDPFLYPLEVLRGALWVAAAVLVLRSTRGAWWWGTLLTALWFALVQNDVHLLPNPLMAPTIRWHHFVETASSNFVWAWAIGWWLGRPAPVKRAPTEHGATPAQGDAHAAPL